MNLENIKVSVIMPVFNDEPYIKTSIESVLNQTHSNLELIIVDDCSTDKTIEIINSYTDHRIKIIKNSSNMGAAFSRNVALKNATGQYVAFLDGDDKWDINKLSKQLFFMIQNNFNFSYTNYSVFDCEIMKNIGYMSGPRIVKYKDFIRCNYVGCLTVMYKREIFPDLQIPDHIKKRNDYALWILLSKKENCVLLNEFLATYTKTGKGISGGKKAKVLSSHYQVFRSLLGCSPLKATILSVRNIFYYFLKKIKYFKKSLSSFNRPK